MATNLMPAKRILVAVIALLTLVVGIHALSTYPCIIPSSASIKSRTVELFLTPSDMGSSWVYTSLPGQRKAQRYGQYRPDWTTRVDLSSSDGYAVSVHGMEFPCAAAATDAMNDAVAIILGTGTPTDDRILKSTFGASKSTLVDADLIGDVSADVRTYCDPTPFPGCEVVIQARGKFFIILVNRSGRPVDRSVVAKAIEGTISRLRTQAEP